MRRGRILILFILVLVGVLVISVNVMTFKPRGQAVNVPYHGPGYTNNFMAAVKVSNAMGVGLQITACSQNGSIPEFTSMDISDQLCFLPLPEVGIPLYAQAPGFDENTSEFYALGYWFDTSGLLHYYVGKGTEKSLAETVRYHINLIDPKVRTWHFKLIPENYYRALLEAGLPEWGG